MIGKEGLGGHPNSAQQSCDEEDETNLVSQHKEDAKVLQHSALGDHFEVENTPQS